MNHLLQMTWPISEAGIERLGWVLVHSLWQFSLLTLLTALILRTQRHRTAELRHGILLLALILLVVVPILTWSIQSVGWGTAKEISENSLVSGPDITPLDPLQPQFVSPSKNNRADVHGLVPGVDSRDNFDPLLAQDANPPSKSGLNWIRSLLQPWLPSMVIIWILGVVVCAFRPLLGWITLRRLQHNGIVPVSDQLLTTLHQVIERLGIHQAVTLHQSTLVQVPVVIGYLRPVILLPVSLVTNLSAAQLETILAHELAHVSRHDFLLNLIQVTVESVFFYHPGVWWLSQRLRAERENCCDDKVVHSLGQRVEYARALVTIEELRGQQTVLALGATAGSLLSRVRRILDVDLNRRSVVVTGQGNVALWAIPMIGVVFALLMTWSLVAMDQPALIHSPGGDDFGPESHGLRCRLLAVPDDVDDNHPKMAPMTQKYSHGEDMTFAVELKNVSDKPMTLVGVRHGTSMGQEVEGKLYTEFYAPQLFSFVFTRENGKPIERPLRVFLRSDMMIHSASTHELAAGQSLVVVLRPGKFQVPMDITLPPGAYQAKVAYHGPDEMVQAFARKHSPDSPLLKAWNYETISNPVSLIIADDGHAAMPPKLVWGPIKDGLQAAVEYRTPVGVVPTDDPPGTFPTKPFVTTIFHLKNVSDRTISFVSETARQRDSVTVINMAGESQQLHGAFYTGWPVLVRWTLKPGEKAELNALTAGIGLIDRPGKYTMRYGINLGNMGPVTETRENGLPNKADFREIVITGDIPVIIRARTPEDETREKALLQPVSDSIKSLSRVPGRPRPENSFIGTAPSIGLEFLSTYPKLHGISLEMTEKQFLEMIKENDLNIRKLETDQGTSYHIPTGDDHTVIVMFKKNSDKCCGIQRVRGEDRTANQDPIRLETVLARRASLTAKAMPLKDAIVALARSAQIECQVDGNALKQVGIDIGREVTITIAEEPLGSAMGRLIPWEKHPGAYQDWRGRKLFITTVQARQEEIKRVLPDWLKPLSNQGILANLDEDNNVVSLYTGEILTDDMLARMKSVPKLRELDIGSPDKVTSAGLKHLAQLTSLQSLTLSGLRHKNQWLGDEAIKELIGLKSLRRLTINMCGITDASVKSLEGMATLSHLSIISEGRLTDKALASLGTMKKLQSLDLSSYVDTEQLGKMHFSAAGIRQLAGLQNLEELLLVGHDVPADALDFPRLTSLSLSGDTITDTTADAIARLRKLKTLQLVYTNITDRGLQAITSLPELRRLNLDSKVITDKGTGLLPKLTHLEHLSLRVSGLTDATLEHLLKMQSLRRLDLSGSGESGLRYEKSFSIAAVARLKALPQLVTLSLTNLDAPDSYLALQELTQLRELTLMMTNIDKKEFDALADRLPNTRINHSNSGESFTRESRKK